MAIEWRKWRDVTNECLAAAQCKHALDLFVVEQVDCFVDAMAALHEVALRDGKLVRPMIPDDTKVYLFAAFDGKPAPWPAGLSREATIRVAQEKVQDLEGRVAECKGSIELATTELAELEPKLAAEREALAALLAQGGEAAT